jgi:hypothetical protein
MPATFQDFAAIKERMFFAANTSLKLETNEWQPAQELGNPAPQTTLGRWVEPGARCSGPSQPAQNAEVGPDSPRDFLRETDWPCRLKESPADLCDCFPFVISRGATE